MSAWKTFWIHGLEGPLNTWINSKKFTSNGKQVRPHELFISKPCYPMESAGGGAYQRKSGSVKCIWVVSLHGSKKDLLNEIKVLNGPYDVYETESIESLRALYPDHSIGGIPYIC